MAPGRPEVSDRRAVTVSVRRERSVCRQRDQRVDPAIRHHSAHCLNRVVIGNFCRKFGLCLLLELEVIWRTDWKSLSPCDLIAGYLTGPRLETAVTLDETCRSAIPRDVWPAESVMVASLWNRLVAVSTSPVWRAERNSSMTSPGVTLLVSGGRARASMATSVTASDPSTILEI